MIKKKYLITLLFLLSPVFNAQARSSEPVIDWDRVPEAGGYIVEIKNPGDKIIVSERTDNNSFKVDLPPGKYFFRLSVLNKQGIREVASNWMEFRVSFKPEIKELSNNIVKGDEESVIIIRGKNFIPGSRVYAAGPWGRKELACTSITETEIRCVVKPGARDRGFYNIEVEIPGVDEIFTGNQSFEIIPDRKFLFSISVMPAFYIPLGVMDDLFRPGFGSYLNFGLADLIWSNFEAGISAGIFSLPGRKDVYTDKALHSTFRLYSGYYFRVNKYFSVFPYAGAGIIYTRCTYTNPRLFESSYVIDPAASLGVSLVFTYNYFMLPVGVNSSLLYEKKGMVYDCSFYAGIGMFL